MINDLLEYLIKPIIYKLRSSGMDDNHIAKQIVNDCLRTGKDISNDLEIIRDLIRQTPNYKNKSKSVYIRSGKKYTIEEIVPLIVDAKSISSPKRKLLDGDVINFKSKRLALFADNQQCVCCGITGSFFVKEKQKKGGKGLPWHLNLYAIDGYGCEILMTLDHIVPKSKAPPGLRDNRQTMCSKCNYAKEDMEISIEKLREKLNIKFEPRI